MRSRGMRGYTAVLSNKKHDKEQKMRKEISVAVIAIGVLILLGSAVPMLIGVIVAVTAELSMPASVGIIGGADGPTAIMISSISGIGGAVVMIVIGILLIAAGIWGLIKAKKSG